MKSLSLALLFAAAALANPILVDYSTTGVTLTGVTITGSSGTMVFNTKYDVLTLDSLWTITYTDGGTTSSDNDLILTLNGLDVHLNAHVDFGNPGQVVVIFPGALYGYNVPGLPAPVTDVRFSELGPLQTSSSLGISYEVRLYPLPEPGAALLTGSSLLALSLLARRRLAASSPR